MTGQLYYADPQYYPQPGGRDLTVSPTKIFGWIFAVLASIITTVAADVIKDTLISKKSETTIVMKLDECADAARHWSSTEADNTRSAYQEHIRQFPYCKFAGLAQQRIAAIDALARRQADDEHQRTAEAEARRQRQEQSQPQHIVAARGWIGVGVQTLSPEIADTLGLSEGEGVIVAYTQPNSPAALAGIAPQDVIWGLNEYVVTSAEEFAALIGGMAPGSTADLYVIRKDCDDLVKISLALGQAPSVNANNTPTPRLGISVVPSAAPSETERYGLAITSVQVGSPAEIAGLKIGDIILQVNGSTVSTATDILSALIAAQNDGKHAVLLRIKSGDSTSFVGVRLSG